MLGDRFVPVEMLAAEGVTATFDVIPGLLFADGFETGDVAKWSSEVGLP